jgi:hypothetical protein
LFYFKVFSRAFDFRITGSNWQLKKSKFVSISKSLGTITARQVVARAEIKPNPNQQVFQESDAYMMCLKAATSLFPTTMRIIELTLLLLPAAALNRNFQHRWLSSALLSCIWLGVTFW